MADILTSLKRKLRRNLTRLEEGYICWRYPFSREDLLDALKSLGIQTGDVLMVHSAAAGFTGFQGRITDVITVLEDAVGDSGTLLLPTLPFQGSALSYAKQDPVFRPNITPSRMGLITEIFRRTPGVVRSLHPTHSVAAWGARAEELIEGHEQSTTPCGEGSPYHRLLACDGKILFLGAGFSSFTFFHCIEAILEEELPFSPFTRETYKLRYRVGNEIMETAPNRLFSPEVSRRRNMYKLVPLLKQRDAWHETKVGRLGLIVLSAADALEAARDLTGSGVYCYETD